jgi:hypothetical protein
MAPEYRSSAQIRASLVALMREHQCSRATASRVIGRDPSYLQRFIARGIPQQLRSEDARKLARFFGVHEREMGVLPNRESAEL